MYIKLPRLLFCSVGISIFSSVSDQPQHSLVSLHGNKQSLQRPIFSFQIPSNSLSKAATSVSARIQCLCTDLGASKAPIIVQLRTCCTALSVHGFFKVKRSAIQVDHIQIIRWENKITHFFTCYSIYSVSESTPKIGDLLEPK